MDRIVEASTASAPPVSNRKLGAERLWLRQPSRQALGLGLGVSLLMAGYLGQTPAAQAQRINVATSEYFDDINPLTERTYVSRWLGQLVAARLFRPRCLAESARLEMMPECAHDNSRIDRDRIQIDARLHSAAHRCQIPPGKDPKEFIGASVLRTVELLNDKELQRNYYHGNGFRIIGNSDYRLLRITTPPNVGEKGLEFLDFPLFSGDSDAAKKSIAPNHANRLNDMTFGSWKIGTATNDSITLRLRYDLPSIVPPTAAVDLSRSAGEIQIKHALPTQLSRWAIRSTGGQGTPPNSTASFAHVFLNVSPTQVSNLDSSQLYGSAFNQSAEGPFYLGFNFDRPGNTTKGELFASDEFRRLLALTLWNTPVLADQFSGLKPGGGDAMPGTWPGQTLLPRQTGEVTRLPAARLQAEVQAYLQRNSSTLEAVNLNVWVTPEGSRMFDDSGAKQLMVALNSAWICDQRCGQRPPGKEVGLFFRFLPDSSKRSIPSADYDIVIDRMVHGGRATRIADAVEPGDPANLTRMTDRHVKPEQRALWRTETSVAQADLTQWLKDKFYFIVLGHFPFRDLYLKDMTTTASELFCQSRGQLMHPIGAHLWSLPR